MRSAWILTALLLTVTLAGCASEPARDAPQDVDPPTGTGEDGDKGQTSGGTGGPGNDDGGGSSGTGGGAVANDTNAAPVPTFAADVTSGTAPLQVNFTLDATDADGDELSWGIDADGDGTIDAQGKALPAWHVATFDAAGNFTPKAFVSDGTANVTATLELTLVAGAPAMETWHAMRKGCGGADILTFDQEITQAELAACGGATTPPAFSSTMAYGGVGTSAGFAAGTPVMGQARVMIWGAGEVSGTMTLSADGTPIGTWTTNAVSMTGHPIGDVPTGRDDVKLTFSGTLPAAIPPGAALSLSVTLAGAPAIFHATGTDDATRMTLGTLA